jgi:hypothetical protein
VFSGITQLNSKLQNALTEWGARTGKNLFIGFWADDDQFFQQAVKSFKIKRSPAIVITANSQIAMSDNLQQSIYITIDKEKILQDDKYVDLAKETLNRLYLLFLRDDFKEAIKQVNHAENIRKVQEVFDTLKSTWGAVGKFLSEHKISIEIGPFKLGIEPNKTG